MFADAFVCKHMILLLREINDDWWRFSDYLKSGYKRLRTLVKSNGENALPATLYFFHLGMDTYPFILLILSMTTALVEIS